MPPTEAYRPVIDDGGSEQVDLADEVGDEPGGGVLVNFLGSAHLEESPFVHHPDAVAHGERLLLIVGHIDEGDPHPRLQLLQFYLHGLAELEVEGAERLVEEQNLRLVHQGPGESDAVAARPRAALGDASAR